MERKKVAFSAVALLLLSAALLDVQTTGESKIAISTGERKVEVTVEIADTPSERRRGLMNRSSLPENHGMLFVYPGEDTRTFWMKNTLIPLDIIFIDSNGTVVDIDHADPEPGVPEEELARYVSDSPAKYVLEVNQNFARRHGIARGDKVILGRKLRHP